MSSSPAPGQPNAPALSDGRRVRGANTRAAIIAAATTLFAHNGYSATSLTTIAAASGTKTASIHHAFGSKAGLLLAVMHHIGDAIFDIANAAIDDPSLSAKDSAQAVMAALIAQPKFLRLFLLLALERGNGDHAVLQIVDEVRARGRHAVARGIEPLLQDVAPARRATIIDEFSRLVLIILDGTFLAHQIDGEVIDPQRTQQLATIALESALLALMSEEPS